MVAPQTAWLGGGTGAPATDDGCGSMPVSSLVKMAAHTGVCLLGEGGLVPDYLIR